MNSEKIKAQNRLSFFRRFIIYQNERFPFLGHGLLIAAFTFSAVSYSRMCRGEEGFINWNIYGWGVFITVTLFFLLRIADEFKDREDDARYRTYLPVPRGLISLKELQLLAIVVLLLQLCVLIFVFPSLFFLQLAVLFYLFLMRIEFGVPVWLKARPVLYMVSHMFIMPLIDIFASGLDWVLNDAEAPKGLLFFFGVSYMNGIVMETGRKIKPAELEEEGVVSYTKLWGVNPATVIWNIMLAINATFAILAGWFAGYGKTSVITLGFLFFIFSIPAWIFLRKKNKTNAKLIEYASVAWTLLMYLILGAVPMIQKLIF
ncbi:MAG: UbiA family prenyltransferase [Bacteroidota bacterium]